MIPFLVCLSQKPSQNTEKIVAVLQKYEYIHVRRSSVRMSRKTFAMTHERDDARAKGKENKAQKNCVKNEIWRVVAFDFDLMLHDISLFS